MTTSTTAAQDKGALIGFFIGFFSNISSWFIPEPLPLGTDESMQLMHRTMLAKSWFDRLAQYWVSSSFWLKCALGTALLLPFALLGLGVAVILALSALFVLVHVALVTHHNQRMAHARVIAAEAVSLVHDRSYALTTA